MRYLAVSLLLLTALLLGGTSQVHAQVAEQQAQAARRGLEGTAAPRLTLKTIDGKDIDLGSLYGKTAVYLKFWATWCVPCRKQMPHFEETFQKAGPALCKDSRRQYFQDA